MKFRKNVKYLVCTIIVLSLMIGSISALAIEPTGTQNNVYTITKAEFIDNNNLTVSFVYTGSEMAADAKLLIASYSDLSIMTDSLIHDINGTQDLTLSYQKPEDGTVRLYIWNGTDGINPLSGVVTAGDAPDPTATPTSAPTVEPTATPTSAPTVEPTATPTVAPTIDPEKTVVVDSTKDTDPTNKIYKTIKEALSAVSANPPKSEAERIYINVNPGIYREQVVVNTPYITLMKTPDTEGIAYLTWYYGTNTKYDSCGSNGYYDENAIDGGTTKNAPSNWGAVLTINGSATGFECENMYVENSFNAYYTQEELSEFMENNEPNGFNRGEWLSSELTKGTSDEVINQFIQSRSPVVKDGHSARERACALYSSADKVVLRNCTFMSKQDTIGIMGNRIYFDNCKIGGTTDYICGHATAIFNECELYWNAGPILSTSSSNATDSGYITAPSQSKELGYVFYNCKVTGSETATEGSMGRPWNPNGEAKYINTKVGTSTRNGFEGKLLISDDGWSSMSGNQPEDARFGEYNSIDLNGNPVNITKEVRKSLLLGEWTMLEYNPYNYMKGSDNWDPASISDKYTGVNQVALDTTVVIPEGASSEVDLPPAPNGYEFYWVSDSEYAIVNKDGTKVTVVRPASGETPIETTITLYVRDSEDKVIGTKAVIPVTINPTTDTENVFTVNGAVSMTGMAPENDLTITVKFLKGNAVIKTTGATIKGGATSATYEAAGIPVGEYDVVIDSTDAEYKVSVPENGRTTVSGQKGDVNTIDISVGKLSTRIFEVITDPIVVGSGSTFNNNNGEFTVSTSAKGTTGGIYWNLSGFGVNIPSTDTLTVNFSVVVPNGFNGYQQNTLEGTAIDFSAGIPGTYNRSANNKRILRVNTSRWEQINMLDIDQPDIAGSGNTEHQWLLCSGVKFHNSNYQPHLARITADFKNSSVLAEAKILEADTWNSYRFEGFPQTSDIDRNNLCLAVYPGTAGANTFIIKDISISYTEFE